VPKTGIFLFLVVVSKSHDEFPFWFWVVVQEREIVDMLDGVSRGTSKKLELELVAIG
jgi:hypothetical protein